MESENNKADSSHVYMGSVNPSTPGAITRATLPRVKIAAVNNDHANLPQLMHAHDDDIGYDVSARVAKMIEPGKTVLIPLGFKLQLPKDAYYTYEAQIRPRSGMSYRTQLNVIFSTIDASFRGEPHAIIHNPTNRRIPIDKHQRIAQMVITRAPNIEFDIVLEDELTPTSRGADGFGSTGQHKHKGDAHV